MLMPWYCPVHQDSRRPRYSEWVFLSRGGEALRLGPLEESVFMTRQLFGAPNGAFASNGESTGFEWLTTDKDAMHRYM